MFDAYAVGFDDSAAAKSNPNLRAKKELICDRALRRSFDENGKPRTVLVHLGELAAKWYKAGGTVTPRARSPISA